MGKLIFAIESSCDETAAAVVEDGRKILSDVIYTQIKDHAEFGGVVPEIASRAHVEKITPVVRKALMESGASWKDISAIAVTKGPGLVGSLLVGVNFAKTLAFSLGLPLIGVNHIEGHISANYLEHQDLEPPYGCLVVSGGHTHLLSVDDYGQMRVLARTRDDAAGGYPGGPAIERAAVKGDPKAIEFPRARIDEAPMDFSFSGLKSAVLNYINKQKMKGDKVNPYDVSASFQEAVIDVLSEHTRMAIRQNLWKKIAMGGGVSANGALRQRMEDMAKEEGAVLYYPSPRLCTDNAAMIGAAGYYRFIKGERADLALNADPSLRL